MENYNGNEFTVFCDEKMSVLEILEEHHNTLKNKTDLYGDHKGSWCGIYPPTMTEEGLRGAVEKNINDIKNLQDKDIEIDTKIINVNNEINTLKNINNRIVDVKKYGALADETGRTPQDTGKDITSEPWNTWDIIRNLNLDSYKTPWSDGKGGYNFPTPRPFANTDTWDYIAIQRAIWENPTGKNLILGNGIYIINKTIVYCGGDGKMNSSLIGNGLHITDIRFKTPFGDNTIYLNLYKIGLIATTIKGITFAGPTGGGTKGLKLINVDGCNQVHIEDCWITTALNIPDIQNNTYTNVGINFINHCTDCFVKNSTLEYLDTCIYVSNDSDIHVDSVNCWGLVTTDAPVRGIVADGRLFIGNSKFIDIRGLALRLRNKSYGCGLVVDYGGERCYNLVDVKNSTLTGSIIRGECNDSPLVLRTGAIVTGCKIEQYKNSTDGYSCSIINIKYDEESGKISDNVIINGNTLTHLGSTKSNNSIISIKDGVGYINGCDKIIVGMNTYNTNNLTELNNTSNVLVNNLKV